MTLRTTVRLLAAALLVGALPAHAAETGGCGAFAWPIEADKALLSKAERTPSGATIDVSAPKAFRIEMTTADKADFAVAPGRPPAPGAPAGTLTFTARAGLYQFTMTDRVWIDLVQAGRSLPEAGFSGVLDCDGARKSVRFELADGPVLIQLSGSPARTTAIAITRDPAGANR